MKQVVFLRVLSSSSYYISPFHIHLLHVCNFPTDLSSVTTLLLRNNMSQHLPVLHLYDRISCKSASTRSTAPLKKKPTQESGCEVERYCHLQRRVYCSIVGVGLKYLSSELTFAVNY